MTFTSDTTITTDQTIAAGETWTIDSGATLTIGPFVKVFNNGDIINNGTIIINETATIENNGRLVNDNTVRFDVECDFCPQVVGIHNSGTIINKAIMNSPGDFVNRGNITNTNLGSIIIKGGEMENWKLIANAGTFSSEGRVNNEAGTIVNNGTIRVFDELNNFADIKNNAGATITAEGVGIIYSDFGTITNEGTMNIFASLDLFLDGTFNNNGKLNIFGHLAFGEIFNDGLFNNNGIIDSNGTITNFLHGTFNNPGTINNCGGSFTNTGIFNGDPVTISEHCSFLVIPESPIGTIAVIASSLAALVGFTYFRRDRNKAKV